MTTKSEAEARFEVLIGHIPMSKIARAKEKRGETKGFMG
jgi:hypothetical protein